MSDIPLILDGSDVLVVLAVGLTLLEKTVNVRQNQHGIFTFATLLRGFGNFLPANGKEAH